MKYLREFLGTTVSSVSSVLPPLCMKISEEEEEEKQHTSISTAKTDESPSVSFRQCAECGAVDFVVGLVAEDGTCSCYACLTGLTAMRRAGVPI